MHGHNLLRLGNKISQVKISQTNEINKPLPPFSKASEKKRNKWP